MALSSACVFEVRTTGSDNSGGAFKAGATGTDRSQQDAAFASGTNLTVDAVTNTKVTPDGYTVVAADVGNVIQITAGTGWTTGFYEITAQGGGEWTLDRSPAAIGITGGTWAMGGALASPGKAAGARVSGNTVWIKAGTYTVTSASTNIAAGCVSDATGGATVTWEGYQTTRGDLGTPPVIIADGVITTFTLFTVTGAATAGYSVRNITVDGNSRTSSQGFNAARRGFLVFCKAQNCSNSGLVTSSGAFLVRCVATGVTGGTAAIRAGSCAFWCESYANSLPGFDGNGATGQALVGCLSYGNTGASSDGFAFGLTVAVNCVAYGNGRDGFRTTNEGTLLVNCIAEGNAAYGFDNLGNANLLNCAAYNNTTAATTGTFTSNVGFVTCTASPFVAAGSNNFALNATSGGGALCRAAGYPGAFPRGTTTGYLDIGAAQSHPPPFGHPGLE